MDIKGVKPVASRIKQRPLGAKTKTPFSGRTYSSSIRDTAIIPAPTTLAKASSGTAMGTKAYSLPQYEAPAHPSRVVRKRLTRSRLFLRIAAICFVFTVTVAGLFYWAGYAKLHKAFHGMPVVAALAVKSSASPGLLQGESNGRINVLLSGISGSGSYNTNLTDTIALLSIDPVNGKATIVNLPADLLVQQPVPYAARQQQLSMVYESVLGAVDGNNADPNAVQAGLDSLDKAVERITGVAINYNLFINFEGFKQAVDAVGGVSVNVPVELHDSTLAWKEHVSPVLARAGVQQMSGDQALLYVRSRQVVNGFTQVQRELQVLTALKDKAMSAATLSDPNKLEALMSSLGDNVYSDLSISGAVRLYGIMAKIGDSNISSVDLIGPTLSLLTSEQSGGSTVAVPTAGFNTYAPIQEYIRSYMPNGYVVNENAPVMVVGPDASGAAITANMLRSYGYNVTATATTAQHIPRLVLVNLSNGRDGTTLSSLESHYRVTAMTELPPGISLPPGGAEFVIIEP
jgi:LCP family protein required for cell wall assembly